MPLGTRSVTLLPQGAEPHRPRFREALRRYHETGDAPFMESSTPRELSGIRKDGQTLVVEPLAAPTPDTPAPAVPEQPKP